MNLNALLQALRNVTFVLQKEKRAIPEFDAWYEPWRETLAKDGVLRWLVEARNHVVKEGDLETFSTATAAIKASWDDPEVLTVEVPPLMQTLAIVQLLNTPDIPDDLRRGGILRVERRWVASTLLEWELLDALSHCYGLLARLIRDAHRQAGIPVCAVDPLGEDTHGNLSATTGGRLPCMVATEGVRTVMLNLRTNEILRLTHLVRPDDDEMSEEAAKRYAGMSAVPAPKSADPLDWASYYMEQAKIVLARDKWHAMFAFLFHADGRRSILTNQPTDQQEKYLFMEEIAAEVRRHGFTGLVFTADAWRAHPADVPPGIRPADVPSRTEAFTVTAIRADGASRRLTTPYTRRFGRIRFGETAEEDGQPFFLAPILRVWGLPVPSEQEAVEELDRRWHQSPSAEFK
jgi:hypothetical protein